MSLDKVKKGDVLINSNNKQEKKVVAVVDYLLFLCSLEDDQCFSFNSIKYFEREGWKIKNIEHHYELRGKYPVSNQLDKYCITCESFECNRIDKKCEIIFTGEKINKKDTRDKIYFCATHNTQHSEIDYKILNHTPLKLELGKVYEDTLTRRWLIYHALNSGYMAICFSEIMESFIFNNNGESITGVKLIRLSPDQRPYRV